MGTTMSMTTRWECRNYHEWHLPAREAQSAGLLLGDRYYSAIVSQGPNTLLYTSCFTTMVSIVRRHYPLRYVLLLGGGVCGVAGFDRLHEVTPPSIFTAHFLCFTGTGIPSISYFELLHH